MAAFEEVDSWACFDEEQDLGGFVDVEEIRDGLLGTVVEKVEVFAVQAADEVSARVAHDDSEVDAVDADANVGSGLGGLLRKSGRGEQENAKDKKRGAVSRGKKHGPTWHRRIGTKKTEALSPAKFPERGTGLAISTEDRLKTKLGLGRSWSRRCRWCCRWSGARSHVFWSGKIAGGLVFADVEDHDFVGSHSRGAFVVKLHGLASGLVFLFDSAVVYQHSERVLRFFLVRLC